MWQDLPDGRHPIPGAFALRDPTTCGFTVSGAIDPRYPLVIDPAVEWGTYLGGSGDDRATGIAVDSSGNVCVCGYTASSGWVSGGYDTSYNGGTYDGFVAKLSTAGAHVWSTYLGGSNEDRATGVAVDSSGNLCVVGYTNSSGWVSGGGDTSWNGGYDGFAVELSSAGVHQCSTYLGGTSDDFATCAAIDVSGNVVVAGYTASLSWVSGGYDTTYNGGTFDGFVVELWSASGGSLGATYLGGGGDDRATGVAVGPLGNICLTGYTDSPGWVSGGWDTTFNGGVADGFVFEYSPVTAAFGGRDFWAAENLGVFNIPVNLWEITGLPVTVNYAVTGGTATGDGVDYTLAAGTLTFNPGETSKSIPVAIVVDGVAEPGETVEITLSTPSGAASIGVLNKVVLHITDESGETQG